jgi:hypothetical protein
MFMGTHHNDIEHPIDDHHQHTLSTPIYLINIHPQKNKPHSNQKGTGLANAL